MDAKLDIFEAEEQCALGILDKGPFTFNKYASASAVAFNRITNTLHSRYHNSSWNFSLKRWLLCLQCPSIASIHER